VSKNKNIKSELSFWALTNKVWIDISAFWKTLIRVILVYAIINFVFVASFSVLPSNEALQSEIETYLGASAGRFIDSIVIVGVSVINFTSPSNTLMQIILFLLASMAFVWTLRKLRGLQKISIRQAYYEGPSNIIPLLLIVVTLLLMLAPSAFASSILSVALPIVSSGLEKFIIYFIAILLIIITLWMLSIWWPSFYISMLPGSKPVASLRAAAKLTKGRRIKLSLKILLILIFLALLFIFIVVPVSLILQRAVPVTVYILMFIVFGLAHMFLFNIYRSLVDESESSTKNK
jgi:hypothetical protein